jgi:hypothetical protein
MKRRQFITLLGGSPARLISVTVTSTPREARSKASVSPTGPAPTTSTLVSMSHDVGSLHQAYVRLDIVPEVFVELLETQRHRLDAERRQSLLHGGHLQRLVGFLVKPHHDVARGLCR